MRSYFMDDYPAQEEDSDLFNYVDYTTIEETFQAPDPCKGEILIWFSPIHSPLPPYGVAVGSIGS